MLHLLPPQQLAGALNTIYDILMPGGSFFFVTDTPYLGILRDFLPIYEQKRAHGEEFPGFIEDTAQFVGGRDQDIPQHVNFLCLDTVERLFAGTHLKLRRKGI